MFAAVLALTFAGADILHAQISPTADALPSDPKPTDAVSEDKSPPKPFADPEVRGTWLTTTGNTAIASATNTAETMRRLREIGLNTVYVESWKNGYTQYPSKVLERVIGIDRRPALMAQDPSDKPEDVRQFGRDLLQETLIEAHRNGLIYIAWFEYGFMAAHKDTHNHLRKDKPEWLSRDIKGNEVAPNGFVWMNPLHPDTRRLLIDLVVEAIDKYDLDGVQLDDRIVWPYYTMGYDDYTKKQYAKDHDGKEPPADPKDAEWTRWRIAKVNEFSKMFVQEVRAKRPGIIISLSPAVYPWCIENYLLEWPKWSSWTASDALKLPGNWVGNGITPHWDEFIPQNYRFSYDAYEKTWVDQIKHMNTLGSKRIAEMYPGIRLVGEGKDSTWEDLKKSVELARTSGNKGHVHWFSRGVLDVFPDQLTAFYDVKATGQIAHPRFGANWRRPSIPLVSRIEKPANKKTWSLLTVPGGTYQVIERTDKHPWRYRPGPSITVSPERPGVSQNIITGMDVQALELLIDRRPDLASPRTHAPAKGP